MRANLNDVASNIPRLERKKSLEKQVKDLRNRINEALATEDKIRAQIEDLQTTIDTLDASVDRALEAGQEDEARRLLEQLKRTEQRLTIAESDLRSHQRIAEELILQVNMLDAKVADQKHAETQQEVQEVSEKSPEDTEQVDTATPTASSIDRLSGMLKQAQERTRERIQTIDEKMSQTRTASTDNQTSAEKDTADTKLSSKEPPGQSEKTDNNLESRINRLSSTPKKSS